MQVDKVLGVRREYNGGPDNAGRHFFELSSIFPTSENSILVVPVRFPPGRAKLSIKPWETGSITAAKTIGMEFDACRIAAMTGGVWATITSGDNFTSSAA
jgi:hypothetical protein